MKNNQRAVRRHHAKRIKAIRRYYFHAGFDPWLGNWSTARTTGIAYHTPCRCSCYMCGNQRKYHGMSRQERKARLKGA